MVNATRADVSQSAAAAASASLSPSEVAKWNEQRQQTNQTTTIVALVVLVTFFVIAGSYVAIWFLTHGLHRHDKLRSTFKWLPGIPAPGKNLPVHSAAVSSGARARHPMQTGGDPRRHTTATAAYPPPNRQTLALTDLDARIQSGPPSPMYSRYPATEADAIPLESAAASPPYSRIDPLKIQPRDTMIAASSPSRAMSHVQR